MSSKEQQELERRERALKTKEEALERRIQQQESTEQRFQSHQQQVADKERANQKKNQELLQRERKLNEDLRHLTQQQQLVVQQQQQLEERQKRRSLLVLPTLLLVCVIAGYTAYVHFNQQQSALKQATAASQNIDKLASVLNMTQEEVLRASNKLANKRSELEKTKSMLSELRNTSDRLQQEITLLRGDQATTLAEKDALNQSAEILSEQLSKLKAQLEDEYLTIDINEAFIEYQEKDLAQQQNQVTHYQKLLQTKDARIAELQQQLESQQLLLGELNQRNALLQKQLENTAPEAAAASPSNTGTPE
ncbi:MAG: hypothetical protein R3183_12160 [Oleiphilaceae bacterium]|nr:hypothetical protein [Oleiphilaceae bacterium]